MNIFTCIGLAGFLMMMESTMAKEVTVKVEGVDVKRGGNLMVMLFSEKGFPKKHQDAQQLITVKAEESDMLFVFTTELNEFALKVLHDENENGKVTKNWTGIMPAEGLGFSNDQKIGLTGPPSYKNAKVSVKDQDTEFSIKLRYP
ncbi:DUF2141 domain-containing protein [Paraglaciecola arctica]|uniref:DUF2141 domain-containing protein n=1 Tax=Paraglaciecola arctica BSs20135 TaxID=493475 RepID=K6YI33_9ALTE|nr:DUF2141 domain-containing protein [Paraglaciecola arctica]GAC17807.1 hypothetical protein GARC_0826 [Paraglaciecola arctica BSs20135]|tara:strand:- start:747 stop:1181 length:435 start_codon:yes stop_codon:yes gene_type:complete